MNASLDHPNPATNRRFARPTNKAVTLVAVGTAVLIVALLPGGDTAPAGDSAGASHVATATAASRAVGAQASAPPITGAGAFALGAVSLPLDVTRAEHVAAATLVLVDGRAGLVRSVDKARVDLTALGGHTVSFNETEGRPTSTDPCPVPIDAYAAGGLRPVAFPCPASGQQADSAQLVMAVPVAKVETLLRRMGAYGEILGRATQIVDAQQALDANAARVVRLERQIARLRSLIEGTAGDTSALRGQLAQKVGELANLEDRRAATTSAVRFGQVALNLTTVRPEDKPAAHSWFVRAVETGWHRLARVAQRIVTLAVIVLPLVVVIGLIGLPLAWRRRRHPHPVAESTGPD